MEVYNNTVEINLRDWNSNVLELLAFLHLVRNVLIDLNPMPKQSGYFYR